MQVLVDPYSEEFSELQIPSDVIDSAGSAGAIRTIRDLVGDTQRLADSEAMLAGRPDMPFALDLPVKPEPVLDRWDVQTHKYQREIAAKVGFLTGLFSGSGKRVAAGVVHEAKRYRRDKTGESRSVEIGVSVRLSVATTALNAKFELSIPNLAAQAQLGMSDARIGIAVVGYFGPIGDLLPAPEDLNVENFSKFTQAAQEIQARVFGPAGVNYLSPTLLSFESDESSERTSDGGA